MTDQMETRASEWPERPWIMAAVGAACGFLFNLLVDNLNYETLPSAAQILRQAAAAGLAVAALSFLLTADRRRLPWAIAFAVGWGVVIALVGYSTSAYSQTGEMAGFPFLSGLLAVGIAAPLFQTMRDEGRRSLPYEKVHRYAWTDGIIGGASLAFTGLTFLVAFLLGALFDAIGITLLKNLLDDGWFNFSMAGAAFGAASAVLRERDPLLGTLQRLVMLVFSVLAPVLAFALAVYLVALPVTGFGGLWKSGVPETPLLLSAAAFAVVFLNAIIGDSPDDRGKGKLWRATEGVLLFSILPLGLLALVSMGMRVGQYGWTPERLWGVIACLIAIAYGVAAWIAGIRGRGAFDVRIRESQKKLAVALCGLALFLALPIVDFGAISASSQMSRLSAGKVTPTEFDWAAMAFDFGPTGRERLAAVAKRGTPEQRALAAAALKSNRRYDVEGTTRVVEDTKDIDQRLRILSPDLVLDQALRQKVAATGMCGDGRVCALIKADADQLVVVSQDAKEKFVSTRVIDLDESKPRNGEPPAPIADKPRPPARTVDLRTAPVEIREVTRRQLFVDGQPVGNTLE